MIEVWKTHPNFPYHEFSSLGRVRTTVRISKFARAAGVILRGTTSKKGYKQVRIKDIDGNCKLRWVHCLVLETFVGPRPTEIHQGGHNNGVPNDNRLNNLKWKTPKENQADRITHGTSNRGSDNPMYSHGLYSRYL